MEKTVNIKYDEQSFPVRISYHLDKNGSVSYRSELLGTSISTFPYHTAFVGATEKESLELLGKALIKALLELLEI